MNTWLNWRDADWVHAARANRELLEAAHELVRQGFGHDIDREGVAGRAALLLLELERRSRRLFATLAARSVARAMHEAMPYGFDGPDGHQVLDVEGCLRRGYWSCADTSAAAAAVFVGGRWGVSLCTETVEGLPQYAHTRLIVAGAVVEPWPEARRPEAHGCTLLDDVSVLLLAPRT